MGRAIRRATRPLRRLTRPLKRIFRPVEKVVRRTFDLLDPIIDLDGSRTKKLMQQQMEVEKEAMDRAEQREKEAIEAAEEKQKFEDKISAERSNLANRSDSLSYEGDNRSSIGQQSGSTSLALALRKGEAIKGDRQNNTMIVDDEEEIKKILKQYRG